jgi:hypothetical protein
MNAVQKNQLVGSRLTQPIALRSPKLAFVLAFFSGPLGFFYVSWRLGVMSCLTGALAWLIWFGLNEASIAGWPIWLPILEVSKSFAPFLKLFCILLQQVFLGGLCAMLTSERNNAIQNGHAAVFQELKNGTDGLAGVAYIYGLLLVVPWALNDIVCGVAAFINAEFVMGYVLLLMPHVLVSGISYCIGVGIIWKLIPKRNI